MENHENHQPDSPAPEPEPTFQQWLIQNGPMLALVGALIIFLYVKFDAEGLVAIAKAALGLGFVIFIHELGHFLVAKWCDVHVQTFSIGFGPALPGCSFTWGETTYKLALFPLGGYVQMVGQVDGDESSDGGDDDPRSYRNKSVWQRMAIISAGVVMNVILAVVCFVAVFEGPGKDRQAGVVARVDSGSPACRQGVRTGAVIRRIGGVEDPYFEDLMGVVMSTTAGQKLDLEFSRPQDSKPTDVKIEPRLEKGDKRPLLGIAPPESLELIQKRFVPKSLPQPAYPGTAAARATPPFEFGDVIVATTDPADPSKVTDLPLDPRKPGGTQRDYFVYSQRMQLLAGQEVTVRVLRPEGDSLRAVDIKVPPSFHHVIGVRMEFGQVTIVREGSPAARAEVHPRDTEQNLEGDVIQRVEVREPDGTTTLFVPDPAALSSRPPLPALLASAVLSPAAVQPWALHQALFREAPLDPVRLPYDLRQWAERLQKAGVRDRGEPGNDPWTVRLTVRRHNKPGHGNFEQYTTKVVDLAWDAGWTFDRVEPFSANSPEPIPELGLGYRVKTTVAAVEPGFPAADDRLQQGDVIAKVQFERLVKEDEEPVKSAWVPLEPDQWAWCFRMMENPSLAQVVKVTVQVKRNKEDREITLPLRTDPTWPQDERGLILSRDLRLQKADSFPQAVAMGLKDTRNSMMQVYLHLRGMLTGRISPDNLGGPLTIANVAYNIAGVDFWEFIFFLGLISINLAVINFLPIPVLDGGHMVFLIYEKIRGRPASEGVRVGATYAGLLLLASLMIFVLYLDIYRLLRG